VVVPEETEGSALGAFVLGAVALGIAPDMGWVSQFVVEGKRITPNPANHAIYQELFGVYQQVSSHLQEDFYRLAAIRERGV
jgi:gluconokinase